MPRLQVIRTLADTRRALTAHDIHRAITSAGDRIDVVSVYRILATLSELGLVHHIGIVDGYRACSMSDDHSHEEEHFVCASCGEVTELPVSATELSSTRDRLKAIGHEADSIKIEVQGTCSNCVARRA